MSSAFHITAGDNFSEPSAPTKRIFLPSVSSNIFLTSSDPSPAALSNSRFQQCAQEKLNVYQGWVPQDWLKDHTHIKQNSRLHVLGRISCRLPISPRTEQKNTLDLPQFSITIDMSDISGAHFRHSWLHLFCFVWFSAVVTCSSVRALSSYSPNQRVSCRLLTPKASLLDTLPCTFILACMQQKCRQVTILWSKPSGQWEIRTNGKIFSSLSIHCPQWSPWVHFVEIVPWGWVPQI